MKYIVFLFLCLQFAYFEKSLEEVAMCLKPGGLLILIDSTGEVLDQDQVTVLPMRSKHAPKGSQLQRLFYGTNYIILAASSS